MHVFNSAFRFNMPHDDSNKCKEDGVKNQQHVMAPTLNYYTNPWMWSKCSRKYITEFLEYVKLPTNTNILNSHSHGSNKHVLTFCIKASFRVSFGPRDVSLHDSQAQKNLNLSPP